MTWREEQRLSERVDMEILVSYNGAMQRKTPLGWLTDLLFPQRCTVCNEPIRGEEQDICEKCFGSIGFVLPPVCPVCGEPVGGRESDAHLCMGCLQNPPWFHKARSISFHEGAVRELLLRLKYGGDRTVIRAVQNLIVRQRFFDIEEYDAVVPVPSDRRTLRERGWNQALLLARGIASRDRIRPLLLARNGGPRQAGLSGQARRRSLRDCFMVRGRRDCMGKKILLIDDVYTTGTTASVCSQLLLSNGAILVDVLTLTRSRYHKVAHKKK